MASLILNAVNPSVDSPGLTRCGRHGALLWVRRVRRGQEECGTMDGDGRRPPASVVEEAVCPREIFADGEMKTPWQVGGGEKMLTVY